MRALLALALILCVASPTQAMTRKMRMAAITGVQPEARAIFTAADQTPSLSFRRAIIPTVRAYTTTGLWAKFGLRYMLAAQTDLTGRLNWKAPGTNTLSKNGTLTFVVARGFNGDGSTGYLGTGLGYNAIPLYAETNAHFTVYVGSGSAAGTPTFSLVTGTYTMGIVSTATLQTRMNDGTTNTVATTSALGQLVLSRDNASTYKRSQRGAALGDATQASTALVAGQAVLLRGPTTFNSTQVLSGASWGSAFTDADIPVLRTIDNAYLAIIGAPTF